MTVTADTNLTADDLASRAVTVLLSTWRGVLNEPA